MEIMPTTRSTAEQKNQKNESSAGEVIPINTQSTIPAIRRNQKIPRNKESTGPGTIRARPPKITPITPLRRQDSFASIELPLFSRVNSFVCDCKTNSKSWLS
jgi:hypothetical protein